MRTITADVLKSDYKLPFPVSIICSGSSGAGKVSDDICFVYFIYFVFQTSFIENLIRFNKLARRPRKIYYFYPKELEQAPVYWDSTFPDIDVEYVADLPNYSRFWNEIEKNSLVVIDDLWTSASNNEHVSNAFKVYSKKQGFSIIIVTQVCRKDQLEPQTQFFFRIFLRVENFHKIFGKIPKS